MLCDKIESTSINYRSVLRYTRCIAKGFHKNCSCLRDSVHTHGKINIFVITEFLRFCILFIEMVWSYDVPSIYDPYYSRIKKKLFRSVYTTTFILDHTMILPKLLEILMTLMKTFTVTFSRLALQVICVSLHFEETGHELS